VLCDRLDPEEVEWARLVWGKHHGKTLPPNGCLQQIAANRFSTPQDVIAILLQGFVRHAFHEDASRPTSAHDQAS
jgi:hypothetical protein